MEIRSRAWGMIAGVGLDALFGDPQRLHPVAGFGKVASSLEKTIYDDSRSRGAVFAAVTVGATALGSQVLARGAQRAGRLPTMVLTAAATWAVLGARSLRRVALDVADQLENNDLDSARTTIVNLVGRDPATLDADGLARAAVESVAENTCDAIVAPLLAGAVAGVPGLITYRAINTLDAMVGHRSPRYRHFGTASARLDDIANYLPARLTAVFTAVAAAAIPDMSARTAWRTARRDAAAHPSPNSGWGEAAFAGALGIRLGGHTAYGDRVEERPVLGDGRSPEQRDIARAARLSRATTLVATVFSAGLVWLLGRGKGRRWETS